MEKFLYDDQILDVLGSNSELSDFSDDDDDNDVNMSSHTKNSSDRDASAVDAPVETKNGKKRKVRLVQKWKTGTRSLPKSFSASPIQVNLIFS